MVASAERAELIRQHVKLKGELEDIKAEIDKLEKANEYLIRQNRGMRQMMEKQDAAETAAGGPASSAKVLADERQQPLLSSFGLPGTEFIMDSISQATAFGDAAKGELFKQACNIADDFAKRLHLNDDQPSVPEYDSYLQKLAKGTHGTGGINSSLSREESGAESSIDHADNSEFSDAGSP